MFRYLCGTTYLPIFYHGNSKDVGVHGFINSDWDRDIDDRKLTSGYVFRLFGGALRWMSKKQSMIALPSIEAEYIASTHASKEVV